MKCNSSIKVDKKAVKEVYAPGLKCQFSVSKTLLVPSSARQNSDDIYEFCVTNILLSEGQSSEKEINTFRRSSILNKNYEGNPGSTEIHFQNSAAGSQLF